MTVGELIDEGVLELSAGKPTERYADAAPELQERIATAEFPTAATRPANSRLDCGKLSAIHGVALPSWRSALPEVVARLVTDMKVA
ncbi:MAG: hypothetical protein B7Z26_07860 [Asticcacaulis sp. 32-58-5]|nr:MAG: hypothetical protein B7Z26_07860 [Asticcacaulis sp. 32-58-5]